MKKKKTIRPTAFIVRILLWILRQKKFLEIKYLIYELAEIENAVYKIAMEIKKTGKRANALDKIQIPRYEEAVKYIQDVLEEKEREDFFRLKKVKDRF